MLYKESLERLRTGFPEGFVASIRRKVVYGIESRRGLEVRSRSWSGPIEFVARLDLIGQFPDSAIEEHLKLDPICKD